MKNKLINLLGSWCALSSALYVLNMVSCRERFGRCHVGGWSSFLGLEPSFACRVEPGHTSLLDQLMSSQFGSGVTYLSLLLFAILGYRMMVKLQSFIIAFSKNQPSK